LTCARGGRRRECKEATVDAPNGERLVARVRRGTQLVYDNALGSEADGAATPISGGDIVVHAPR